jgi:hypothetical protein
MEKNMTKGGMPIVVLNKAVVGFITTAFGTKYEVKVPAGGRLVKYPVTQLRNGLVFQNCKLDGSQVIIEVKALESALK